MALFAQELRAQGGPNVEKVVAALERLTSVQSLQLPDLEETHHRQMITQEAKCS